LNFGSEGWWQIMLHHFISWRKWYIHNWLLIVSHHRNHFSLLHSRPISSYMCKASFCVSTDVTPIMYPPWWMTFPSVPDYELNQHSLTIKKQSHPKLTGDFSWIKHSSSTMLS
jgi:hypothetical protein